MDHELNPAQYINQTSGKQEYYTPQPIIEAARRTLGSIDLDPASSSKANKRVDARHFFTAQTNGLEKSWFGSVWMNHPFGRKENPLWISKLLDQWTCHNVDHAICITFACTSEKWFQPLMAFPQCYLSPRTNYYLPDGSLKRGVTKGSVVTYVQFPHATNEVIKFIKAFEKLGRVMVPA